MIIMIGIGYWVAKALETLNPKPFSRFAHGRRVLIVVGKSLLDDWSELLVNSCLDRRDQLGLELRDQGVRVETQNPGLWFRVVVNNNNNDNNNTHYSSFHFRFHYPSITPIYYGSFHVISH